MIKQRATCKKVGRGEEREGKGGDIGGDGDDVGDGDEDDNN